MKKIITSVLNRTLKILPQSIKNIVLRKNNKKDLRPDFIKEKTFSNMPDEFRNLFILTPLEDTQWFIGREKEFKEFTSAIQPFSEGKAVSMSLIGERGIGKTSFLHIHKSLFQDIEWIYIPISRREDYYQGLKDLFQNSEPQAFEGGFEEHVLSTERKTVIILDNCQNLFLRVVGGFECLKELLNLINSTRNNILWLLSFNNYAWDYLNYVLTIQNYFKKVLTVSALTGEEIESLIMRRLDGRDFRINFLSEEEMLDTEKEEAYRSKFFSSLAGLSGGNPYIAISYWLKSLKFNQERNSFFVFQPSKSEINIPKEYDIVFLLVLRAFLEHGSLTFTQLTSVMNKEPFLIRSTLDELINDNIIVIESNELYTLNPFYLRVVSDTLKKRKIIP